MLPLPTVRAGPTGRNKSTARRKHQAEAGEAAPPVGSVGVGARPHLGITNCDASAHAQRFRSTVWSGNGFAVDGGRAMTARYLLKADDVLRTYEPAEFDSDAYAYAQCIEIVR